MRAGHGLDDQTRRGPVRRGCKDDRGHFELSAIIRLLDTSEIEIWTALEERDGLWMSPQAKKQGVK
jgi:hypothetical protein